MDAALTYEYEQSLLCSCGNPIDESTDYDIRTAWIAERVVCWACAAKERTAEGDRANGKRPAPGTKYRTVNRAKGMPRD